MKELRIKHTELISHILPSSQVSDNREFSPLHLLHTSYTPSFTEPCTMSFSTCCTGSLHRVLLRGLQRWPRSPHRPSDDARELDSQDRSLLESKQRGTLLTSFVQTLLVGQ